MDFRIDAQLPATAAQLWAIFFDVQRVAGLIPGCENVAEVEPLKEYSALMKQRIGPFKLEVPTRIAVESYTLERHVALRATGRDKFTGTTIDVQLKVDLDAQADPAVNGCKLALDAHMQVAGRLASLGYPVVKKRSEELFAKFEKRLRNELVQFDAPPKPHAAEPASAAPAIAAAARAGLAQEDEEVPPQGSRSRTTLLWPRTGISVAAGLLVALAAWAFGQSPWWWVAAPMLGVAAGIGRENA
jgi:carbon monoxide dehydrogenase subunit G